MIKPSDAISIIAKRLKTLIDTNQLDATYEESDSTLSVYIDDIKLGRIPLLTLRLSDHNVNMHYFYHNRPTNPSQTTNLSIEFYKPKYKNGKRVRNRAGRNVAVDNRSHATPFDITYYSYPSNKLDTPDIEPIYKQILIYVKGGEYKDPFIGTDKEAKTDTVSANFIIKDPRNDIPQNISGDRIAVPATSANYGTDYVSESKRTIRLNEADLRLMVKNCVRRILAEYKDNTIFGWNHIEKTRRDSGASDKEIELLHQSYDEFGAEKALKGEIPNDTGFEIWCSKKDAESCRNGKGMRYPDYRG